MFRIRFLFLAALLVLACGCSGLSARKHPNFKIRQPELRQLAVLAPSAQVLKVTFKGQDEPIPELIESVKGVLAEEIAYGLEERGYGVSRSDLSREAIAESPELKEAFFEVETIFTEKLSKKGGLAFGKFEHSVGSGINLLADHADAQAFMIAHCEAYKKSGGEMVKDIFKTIAIAAATLGSVAYYSYPSGAFVQMALIDGDSGDILWYTNSGSVLSLNVSDDKALRKHVRHLVKRLPKAKKPE